VLWVASPSVITHDELHLISGIADIAASALYRADLSEQTTRLFREHQQLSEELRRAERHLAGIVESASDLVISADINARIITWNRAAERISGFGREQAIGRRLSDYCPQSDRAVMDGLLRQFFSGPHTGQIDELPLVDADGQTIPISWRFSPLQNDLGEITGIVAVGRDLIEQRRLESQLFQAAKMTSMGIMASGIGHELRNPLGIISASAQLAQDHLDNPELISTCLTRIHSATRRAALIIDSLLTFAQPSREVRQAVQVNEVLIATFTLLEYQIRQRQIVFTTVLDPLIPPIIGNPALLQQVFTNLILNACQAMPDGGALAVTSRLSDASTIEISVRDEGCGISTEVLAHIFDPFFTTRPVSQGTGLGLAISYSIVQQHGGQIEVSSQPGAGSSFTVRLPVTEITHHSMGSNHHDQDTHY
jgi:PAS domain S-box-containing protein